VAVVNVGTMITKALTKVTGRIPRATMVVWFNEVVDDILSQPRTWFFLTQPLTLTVTNSVITIPAGVSEILSIKACSVFFTKINQLGQKEANRPGAYGYTLSADGSTVTLYTSSIINGTATVSVEQDITTDYADNADTIFPSAFQGLFLSGLRKQAFYVDKDGRYTAEGVEYDTQMGQCKAWDNRNKPRAHSTRKGYVRGIE